MLSGHAGYDIQNIVAATLILQFHRNPTCLLSEHPVVGEYHLSR
jgi:hypothetical protein